LNKQTSEQSHHTSSVG